jgi:Protein of unknown function (DUF2786)
MNDSRKKMLERVKAILAKTMDNGCTESEAMAALAKARELMATYEIDENELNVNQEQEKAHIYKSDLSDPYEIKFGLAVPVGKFTRCRVWNGKLHNYGISYCGLESDVIFAEWLLNTLQRFVMRALREFQATRNKESIANSRFTSASFVIGCVQRIAEKLKELTPVEPIGAGLVVSRKALIDAELAKHGIVLHKAGKHNRDIDQNSAMAGHKAGNSARFDRPINQGGQLRLTK